MFVQILGALANLFRGPGFKGLNSAQCEAVASLVWASLYSDGEPTPEEAEGVDGILSELPLYWEEKADERLYACRERMLTAQKAGELDAFLDAQLQALVDFSHKEHLVAVLIATSKEEWEVKADTLTVAERAFLLPIAAKLGVDLPRFDAIAADLRPFLR
jgi:hypothetical protein